MNDMSSAPTLRPAIEWQPPIINDIPSALEDVGFLIERLGALLNSNNEDLLTDVAQGVGSESWLRQRANEIWMISIVAEEKLSEIGRIVAAMAEIPADRLPSSVARHVDLHRSRAAKAQG